MNHDDIRRTLSTIPTTPGCYQYYDAEGELIYVGKAKNLRKRVSSYFQKEHTDKKTRLLVSQIANLRYTVVSTEAEALILELNLIKTYKPKYNVLLKDGKTYPSIVVRKECFPRIDITRDLSKRDDHYYGPYPSMPVAWTMIHLIRDLYKPRTCKLLLTPDKIAQGRYKVCLRYHIGKCLGPCEGFQSHDDYMTCVKEASELLKGKLGSVLDLYKERMYAAAAEYKYEEAQIYKTRIEILRDYSSKHTVAPFSLCNVDVFSYDEDGHIAYVNYIHVAEGVVSRAMTVEYKKAMDEEASDIFASAIIEIRQRYESTAMEVILPFDPGWNTQTVIVTIPQRGDKKKLLDLSAKNVRQYKLDQALRAEKLNPEQRTTRLMKQMKRDLHLHQEPRHIECFDNSNIQGNDPVASCVVFVNGKPSKRDYRRFHVKTVIGSDDFASMREILHRRYSRIIAEGGKLPDLVVVDGGKGQLSSAVEVMKRLDIYDRVPVIGMAKRLEEVYYPHDPIPLILDKNSETLRIIQRLRDESHRFAISFHRDVRSKGQTKSQLDEIKGIGPKTKQALLNKFKSVKGIIRASEQEIAEIAGKNKAHIIKQAIGTLDTD